MYHTKKAYFKKKKVKIVKQKKKTLRKPKDKNLLQNNPHSNETFIEATCNEINKEIKKFK